MVNIPLFTGFLYIPGGAGFLSSTVPPTNHWFSGDWDVSKTSFVPLKNDGPFLDYGRVL